MYIRRNDNNKEIKGILPMNEARNRFQNRIFDNCYNTCFKIHYMGFTINDRNKFRAEYSFFVEDLDSESFEIEFASFHFFNWIKRLGMKCTPADVKLYVLDKIFKNK
jgi:hypothetical protein